ncbi:MAG TPA: hypothetical protein VKJ77_07350, partial [Caballeronia sp.]|nr:hypothetical protein [Caballeronia sp.]
MGLQLAIGFAVPVIALILVSGAVFAGFARLSAAKQDLLDKTALRAHVRDIETQMARTRYAARGYVISLSKKELATVKENAAVADADIAYAQQHAGLVADFKEKIQAVSDVQAAMLAHTAELTATATADDDALIEGYRSKSAGS